MIRDDAVALLKGRLSKYSGTDLDANIVSEMQSIQENELEGGDFLPWFLFNLAEQSISTTIGDPQVAVPTGFLMEWEEGEMWRYDASSSDIPRVPINKADYQDIHGLYPGSGEPKGYDLQGDAFWFAPTPDAVYEYRFYAYMRDQVLSTNIENQWLKYASDWMIALVGAKIAGMYMRDTELSQMFLADAVTAKNRVMIRHQALMEANKRRIMGRISAGEL